MDNSRFGLGVGLDLPWDDRKGFCEGPDGSGRLSQRTKNFYKKHEGIFDYTFLSFQPKDRNRIRWEGLKTAYDDFFDAVKPIDKVSLHHTLLNLGTVERWNKKPIIKFTNDLVRQYGFLWINEDIGIWSVKGKTLPYPIPPFLTEFGLRASIDNVREYQDGFIAPLLVEFPGFTEGTNFHIGTMDFFEFFGRLAEETQCRVTLDLGHILSYQWLKGRTWAQMYEGLDALPYDKCVEIHLAGCRVANGKFRDLHHGILLDEQLALLEFILPKCPALKVVTYEDPVYTTAGELSAGAGKNFKKLQEIVGKWKIETSSLVS